MWGLVLENPLRSNLLPAMWEHHRRSLLANQLRSDPENHRDLLQNLQEDGLDDLENRLDRVDDLVYLLFQHDRVKQNPLRHRVLEYLKAKPQDQQKLLKDRQSDPEFLKDLKQNPQEVRNQLLDQNPVEWWEHLGAR